MSNNPTTTPEKLPSIAPVSPTPAGQLTMEAARQIAVKSDCTKVGEISQNSFYNPSSQTWWFDIAQTDKPNCKPACVVSETQLKAEVNWRCSGGIVPK